MRTKGHEIMSHPAIRSRSTVCEPEISCSGAHRVRLVSAISTGEKMIAIAGGAAAAAAVVVATTRETVNPYLKIKASRSKNVQRP